MEKELNEKIQKELNKDEKNEYSIYDYLKNTPSVFIAAVSAIIAVVSFFARLMMNISLRQELVFWDINPDHLAQGNESIIYNAVVSIIYAFLTMMLAMWFSATCEAYASYKQRDLTMHYFKKLQKKDINKLKLKIRKDKATEEEKDFINNFNEICLASQSFKKDGKKEFFFNVLPIIILSFLVTLFFTVVTINDENVLSIAFVCFAIQLITLFVISKIHNRKIINKKEIKKNCLKTDYIKRQLVKDDPERFPIGKVSRKGIRMYMNNINIVMIVVLLFINCISMCVTAALSEKNPTKNISSFQTITLDDTMYALVYQNGNQYFLEEAKSTTKEIENAEPKEILAIYTNRQRIITCDDIEIEVKKYDDIIKEHKPDTPQENSNNE